MNKHFLVALIGVGAISLAVGLSNIDKEEMKAADAVSAQPGFTYPASYTRPMHFSDPLTSDGNATYGDKYINCFLSVERTNSGLDFDLVWTHNVVNEHTWITIVLGNTEANLYTTNPDMTSQYDKFMIKPLGGTWAFGAPGVVKATGSGRNFYDWPVNNSGWTQYSSNIDLTNQRVTFHVDYAYLNTIKSKSDDAHIFAIQFYHDRSASPVVDNALMGAYLYWRATDVNGTCSGDVALMQGNPLVSQCEPSKSIAQIAPTHTWSVGSKYSSRDCSSYNPHGGSNEYFCEIIRDDTNKELILDAYCAGNMEVREDGRVYKNIEFVFTPVSSDNGGWILNSTDLVTRCYRKSNTEMFADIVTGDLNNAYTTSESELFPNYSEKNYNYANHTVATPKSATIEEVSGFGSHFRLVYDLNDPDLALLKGDFKVEGIPFNGTDGVWCMDQNWDLCGNEYFGSSISDTGDMAFQNSYVPIDSNYFAVQNALNYFFTNVPRDSSHSICSIVSDKTRLNAVTSWYSNLSATVVNKLAITPDYKETVKDTMDYLMRYNRTSNPHALILYPFVTYDDQLSILLPISTGIMVLAIGALSFLVVKKKKQR